MEKFIWKKIKPIDFKVENMILKKNLKLDVFFFRSLIML